MRCETVLVEHQDPVETIHTAERSVDLVVMGTHGRRGFDRLMFGSVAEAALHRATKPYLMIRHSDRERVEAEQPSPTAQSAAESTLVRIRSSHTKRVATQTFSGVAGRTAAGSE